MGKKLKQRPADTPPFKKAAGAKSPIRKYLIVGIILTIAALGAYWFWSKKTPSNPKEMDFSKDSGAEPTLTANNPRLQLLNPEETGVSFQNQIIEDSAHNIILNLNIYNGGGVAVADVNNDQLPDLYFVCSNGKNRLYINKGNFKFKDITDAAGVGSEKGFETSATAVDVNADGWLDLYVCRAGTDPSDRVAQLFINNQCAPGGEPTFSEQAASYGLADRGPCSGANFFDYDNDGDLDCYVINHPNELAFANRLKLKYGPDGKTTVPDLDPKEEHDSDNLYQNQNGKFVYVSKQTGIQNFGFGLSVSATDFNGDGWMDIYVGNDFVQPDNLFINNQKGGFTDQLSRYLQHTSMSTMGSDVTDFDNDGRVDIMTVDMFPATNQRQKLLNNSNSLSRYLTFVKNGFVKPVTRNVLQRNNGNGTFSDIACLAGIYKTDWSWSCLIADLDNDGFRDIHVANGYRRDLTHHDFVDFIVPEVNKTKSRKGGDLMPFVERMPEFKVRNFVFQNKGDWRFEDKSGEWMTMPGSWSNGGAWADFDADGDLDLVVNNLEQPAFIYKNLTLEQNSGNFLQAKLLGSPVNPFAVGASVLIEYQGKTQYQELNPNHGIFSSVEHLIHFGLGQVNQLDRLTVRWPDGKMQILTNVPVNQRLNLKWTDATGYIAHLAPEPNANKHLFKERTPQSLGITFKHQENSFLDFETWLLNPWTVTDLGPVLVQGDANGDGLDDFFVGNSFDAPGAVYLQTAAGSFRSSSEATFQADKRYEDHGGVFFDADQDGDQDLFVLSGGADSNMPDLAFQCRLYINDGKGNFVKNEGAVPPFKDLGLRVASHDFDGDGDADLFIGGRVVPKNWPLTPRSVVLQNNNGKFTDVSDQVAGEFGRCGMVTDLQWADLDRDGQKELIVVGEWMAISVFKVQQGKLVNTGVQSGFAQSNGLWNRLAISDLDGDGDLDLVTGNLGLNTRYTAGKDSPFLCYAKDFDNNGTLDPIVAIHEKGKVYPLVQKDVLVKQMPILKKKFLYARDYSRAAITDIWDKNVLNESFQLSVYDLETCWWENQGGKFIRHSFPSQVQASPIQGIICHDFNKDGFMDILMAGNKYGFEVETNPCDAGTGVLLIGDGKGNFTWLDNLTGGFWATKEARDLTLLKGKNGVFKVVVANNNNYLEMWEN